MATVPPGNKQIGEFTAIASVSVGGTLVSATLLEGYAVVDPTTKPAIQGVQNKQIGEFTSIATVGNNPLLSCVLLEGYAVVSNAPPASASLKLLEGYTVVKDSVGDYPVAGLQNKQIGDFVSIATLSMSDNSITSCLQLEGFALVQEFVPRNELTVFNIEYAADAEFNQTPPQGAN